ncbi:MAG: CPBP family intramembrane glutamic endopeptidase [Candidatus Marinimicrobia bacterium]|nr:CPBP family intramembrane glutamic endopeptidase [Candidatus Neomarinimicrobiota bacterium]
MFTILLLIYITVSLIISKSVNPHPSLENWICQFHDLFQIDTLLTDLLWGSLTGIGLIVILSLLDVLVALISRVNIREWIHRTDHLLPVTAVQKRWALSISIVGSLQEEIMFRGFIFIALIPLWSHWIWTALLLSAVFSLLHASVQGFWSTLWIFIISVVLCMIVALGGSIYFVAIAHILINITNLFILPLFFKKHDE